MKILKSALLSEFVGATFTLSAPAANALTYAFDVTTLSGTVLNLNITADNADSVLTPGFDITQVTGTVGGLNVSNFSGVWGGNGDQVSSGLFLDPFQNQNAPHVDSNGTNVFTVQNPPGSGGANFEIDNIYYTGTTNLSYQGGIALLLSNGATYYVSANCNPGNSGVGCDGGYYDVLGGSASFPTPLPSTWTMLLAGFVGLGFFAYHSAKNRSGVVATA